MIRNRIVVRICDASLAEKLQLNSELTLTKAVTLVRQAEVVKQRQPLLRGQNHTAGVKKPDTPVGAILKGRSGYGRGVAMAEEKVKDKDEGFPVESHSLSAKCSRCAISL